MKSRVTKVSRHARCVDTDNGEAKKKGNIEKRKAQKFMEQLRRSGYRIHHKM